MMRPAGIRRSRLRTNGTPAQAFAGDHGVAVRLVHEPLPAEGCADTTVFFPRFFRLESARSDRCRTTERVSVTMLPWCARDHRRRVVRRGPTDAGDRQHREA